MADFVVNPFVSEAQRRWMYANNPEMAKRWQKHTPKGKKLPKKKGKKKPTTNKRRWWKKPIRNKRKNPLRIDPTRTITLRRAFIVKLRKQFALLKGRLSKLIIDEDSFGLKEINRKPFTANAEHSGLIEVPDIRQPNHYFCGAAVTYGVAQYFGVGASTLSQTATHLGTTLEKSTHPNSIIQYLESLGLEVEARPNMQISDLAEYHHRGMPVICPVQDYNDRREKGASFDYGHYLTVIGVGMGYVFCQDSSIENLKLKEGGSVPKSKIQEQDISAPGRIMVREEEWLRVWHDKDEDGNKFLQYGIAVGKKGVTNEQQRDEKGRFTSGGGGDDTTDAPSLLDRAKGLPSAILSKIREKVKEKYDKLEARYGPKYAKAIVASAVAGLPLPIPGSMAITAAPMIALAEMHRLYAARVGNELICNVELTDEEIDRAAAELIQELKDELKDLKVTENTRWRFNTTSQQVDAFQAWLKDQMGQLFRNKSQEALWQAYIQQGFRKGAGRSYDDVKGSDAFKADPDRTKDFYKGTKEEFLRSSFAQPEAVEKVKLLAARSYDDLEGITNDMSTRMSRTLTDGLVEGKNPRDLVSDLADDADISRSRAETIARTELIRAHAEGQLTALENLGVEEVGVAVEWLATDDDKVCPLCEDLEGVVLTIDEARNMLPRHPNCRCSWTPANVGEDDSDQKDTKAEIDEASDGYLEVDKDRPKSIL